VNPLIGDTSTRSVEIGDSSDASYSSAKLHSWSDSLPGVKGVPGTFLPGVQGIPDTFLPGVQGIPGTFLPGEQGIPGTSLPGVQGIPDTFLSGVQGIPDTFLSGVQGIPEEFLPGLQGVSRYVSLPGVKGVSLPVRGVPGTFLPGVGGTPFLVCISSVASISISIVSVLVGDVYRALSVEVHSGCGASCSQILEISLDPVADMMRSLSFRIILFFLSVSVSFPRLSLFDDSAKSSSNSFSEAAFSLLSSSSNCSSSCLDDRKQHRFRKQYDKSYLSTGVFNG